MARARGAATELETTSSSERTRVTGTSESISDTTWRRLSAASSGVLRVRSKVYIADISRSGVSGR